MDRHPPVILLGGQENALAIVRSLTRRGLSVIVSAEPSSWALRSRYCSARHIIPVGVNSNTYWQQLLLGEDLRYRGAVVFACSDEAIDFVAKNRDQLERHYLLDDQIASQQLAMLDKQETLRLAANVGVPTPKQWPVHNVSDVSRIEHELQFPVLLKPIHSHLFQKLYKRKLLVIESAHDLKLRVSKVLDDGLPFTLTELVPGPDHLLSSYYTYITRDGDPLFHFTKRVIRRSPPGFGMGAYHITQWLPETAEVGKRFFSGINFRGLGNIEFKRDVRDGQLKVIEVNARFTAAHALLVDAGLDIAWIIYEWITSRRRPASDKFKEHRRMLYLLPDFSAFRMLHRQGELGLLAWLRSIAYPQVLPFFSMSDPMPAVAKAGDTLTRRFARRAR